MVNKKIRMLNKFNIYKRTLFLFLFSTYIQLAFADYYDVNYNGLKYTVNTETRTAECKGLANGETASGDLIIPDYISYNGDLYPITEIGPDAFDFCSGFTGSLTIGNSVKTIGDYAFYGCSGFTGSLTIPDSVVTIGDDAFNYCSGFTGSLTIPASVVTIGKNAFRECMGFTGSLTIGNTVTIIGEQAFYRNGPKLYDNVISYNPNPPHCEGTDIFSNSDYNSYNQSNYPISLFVPDNSIDLYKNADGWNNFYSIEGISSKDGAISISVNPSSVELAVGEKEKLSCKVEPENSDWNITWISGDPTVAEVNQDGVVTAIAPGTAIIYAKDTSGVTGFSTIRVKDNKVVSIDVTPEKLILELGETNRLTAQVNPSGAESQITWSSRDTSIAQVDGQGLVTAVGKGTTFIFAKSENGVVGVATVTVIDSNEILSITITPENLELVTGEESQLGVILQPSTSSQEITWISSDTSVAVVSHNGVVTALNPGVAVVYAVAENGLTGFSTVRVISNEVTSIVIDPDNLTLELDETAQLTLILAPVSAEAEITWTSTDATVATVDNMGLVTARETGFTFIYATCDNGVTGFAIVKVVDPNAEDYDPDHGFGENGAFVSNIRIREGDKLGLYAERPTGYENNDWTYNWYLNGVLEADGKSALVTAGENSGWQGNVKETVAESYEVEIFNSVGDELILNLPVVSVYSRPLTPMELLKKGDGTTYSFIAMSQFTDKELESLGYYFVFGYTDGDGVNHVISNSGLRYCHTTKDIYDNSQNRFWVYTTWTFPDGANITSGLRYLDGAVDENFDRSDFNLSRSSRVNSMENDSERAIYTLSGNYVGKDFSRLGSGFYIISERNGNYHTTRKIIKR